MKDFYLSESDKKDLLTIARLALKEQLMVNSRSDARSLENLQTIVQLETGAFVSLYKKGELRGCIGRIESKENIDVLVRKMTISAATQDHRFKSIKANEIDEIEIEISVLSPKIKIDTVDDFNPEKHGIFIQKGNLSGTFLPQVAADTGWSKVELLEKCALDKVGIKKSEWKDADLYVYEVVNFSENEFNY